MTVVMSSIFLPINFLPEQETPYVIGKVKNIYLRFGNVKFFIELLKLPEQEQSINLSIFLIG